MMKPESLKVFVLAIVTISLSVLTIKDSDRNRMLFDGSPRIEYDVTKTNRLFARSRHSPAFMFSESHEIVVFTSFIYSPARIKIQKIVVQNWSLFYPKMKCVLFVNFTEREIHNEFEGLVQFAMDNHWLVFPLVDTNSFGTPFLLPMFTFVITTFKALFYGYVNGDNIFDDSLVSTLDTVRMYLPVLNFTVLVTGQRRNIVLDPSIDTNSLWKLDQVTKFALNASTPVPFAEDYFFVTRTFPSRDFSHVVVGRDGVDNYLVLRAQELRIPTVDTSLTVTDVHIRPYSGRVYGRQSVDGHFNYRVVGQVTWSKGYTDATVLKTVKDKQGRISVTCRQSPQVPLDKCLIV